MSAPARSELVVVADLQGLRLCDVWDIEDRLQEVTAEVSDYIDEQIRYLAREGWTQKQIAEECKRSQKTISVRMARLQIEPPKERGGRPKGYTPRITPDLRDVEVLDGEPVVEIDDDETTSGPETDAPAPQYTFCPTCGHKVRADKPLRPRRD